MKSKSRTTKKPAARTQPRSQQRVDSPKETYEQKVTRLANGLSEIHMVLCHVGLGPVILGRLARAMLKLQPKPIRRHGAIDKDKRP